MKRNDLGLLLVTLGLLSLTVSMLAHLYGHAP